MTDRNLIRLKGISKRFGRLAALNEIDLTLNAGTMLALLGHNGAGKTTLMKIILGLLQADSGSVEVLGQAPGTCKHLVGYVPENVSFYPSLSGMETLTYFAKLNGASRAQAKQLATKLLDRVGIDHARTRAVKTYSKGMKQRLGLAQALLGEPQLLILDEPTVGLDPVASAELFTLLAELQHKGCGIIICTHVLPGLEQYLDDIMILQQGNSIAYDSLIELQSQAQLPVTIRPRGLNGNLSEDPDLAPYLQQNGLLKVPADNKLAVMQSLLNKQGINDLALEPPSLTELYQYYINEAEEHLLHNANTPGDTDQ